MPNEYIIIDEVTVKSTSNPNLIFNTASKEDAKRLAALLNAYICLIWDLHRHDSRK